MRQVVVGMPRASARQRQSYGESIEEIAEAPYEPDGRFQGSAVGRGFRPY